VQMAAKLVIEPIFEANFDEAAYGYRPRRSAEQAVRRVHQWSCPYQTGQAAD
jgi:RNA-directed DNA polymerase